MAAGNKLEGMGSSALAVVAPHRPAPTLRRPRTASWNPENGSTFAPLPGAIARENRINESPMGITVFTTERQDKGPSLRKDRTARSGVNQH